MREIDKINEWIQTSATYISLCTHTLNTRLLVGEKEVRDGLKVSLII